MGVIERYIFRQTMAGMLLTLATLTTLVWLTQALRHLDLLTTKGQSAGVFFLVTMMLLPIFVSVILPIALFVASIFTLNKLNADSELVVINAAGASRWRTISPFLALATIVALVVGYINLELVPRSKERIGDLLTQVQTDLIATVLREGQFKSTAENMTFHVRERAPSGEMFGLLVQDSRNANEEMTYLAERGRLISDNDRNFLIMENGTFQRQTGSAQQIQIVKFSRYVFDLSQFKRAAKQAIYRPSQRPTSYLFNPDPDDPQYIENPGKFRQELHYRFSSSIYPFMLAMVVLAAVGFARTTRQNRGWGVGAAIVVGLLGRLAGFAFHNLSSASAVGIVMVYLWPLAITLGAGLVAFGIVRPDRIPWLVRFSNVVKGYVAAYWALNMRILNKLFGIQTGDDAQEAH